MFARVGNADGARGLTEVDVEIAEGLIGAGIVFVADPEAVFVELDVFPVHAAEDHATQPAIADGQCLGFPVLGGGLIPNDVLLRRGRLFRHYCTGEGKRQAEARYCH